MPASSLLRYTNYSRVFSLLRYTGVRSDRDQDAGIRTAPDSGHWGQIGPCMSSLPGHTGSQCARHDPAMIADMMRCLAALHCPVDQYMRECGMPRRRRAHRWPGEAHADHDSTRHDCTLPLHSRVWYSMVCGGSTPERDTTWPTG